MLISKFRNDNIEDKIIELEKKYNIILPNEYRRFLLKYNGGKTPETYFKIGKIASDIQGFYGVGEAEIYYNFKSVENVGEMEEWISKGLFPIAINSFGDYIMIGINKENIGKVYFYYHDRKMQYVEMALNLKDFIDNCKSKKIGHIRSIEERKDAMVKLGKGDKITEAKLAGWQAEIDEYSNIKQEEIDL